MKYIKETLNEFNEIHKQLLFRVSFVYPYCVFMDASFVLFLVCLSTCGCVGFQVPGPLRDCPRAGRFRASLLLHTTCVRSCCTWRATVAAWWHNNGKKRTLGASNFPISPHHFSYVVECFERHWNGAGSDLKGDIPPAPATAQQHRCQTCT